MSSVTPLCLLRCDWSTASEYYIQQGQSPTEARRGQTVTPLHMKTINNTSVCFRRSSSIRKPRPAASLTFELFMIAGRPAANQRPSFPVCEGENKLIPPVTTF